jgi:hypothetical protein
MGQSQKALKNLLVRHPSSRGRIKVLLLLLTTTPVSIHEGPNSRRVQPVPTRRRTTPKKKAQSKSIQPNQTDGLTLPLSCMPPNHDVTVWEKRRALYRHATKRQGKPSFWGLVYTSFIVISIRNKATTA